jgi:putative phosphotransacetylase
MADGASDRLGDLLTAEEWISDEQLQEALQIQKQHRNVSIPSRLGEVLVYSEVCSVDIVARALHKQRDRNLKENSLGQVLVELGTVSKEQLETAMLTHLDVMAPLGEILLDQEICTQNEIKEALEIQHKRRFEAMRRPLASSFDPLNVMEILAGEMVDEVIHTSGGCRCLQCRACILAICLNGLASRYVSNMEMLVSQIQQYREDFGGMIRDRLLAACEQVRAHPKLSHKSTTGKSSGRALGNVVTRVSNRHVHLRQDHVEQLFGAAYELTQWKELVQPGQFAAKETVILEGPKGAIEKVRVLGPPRAETQVEISGTDQYKLGVRAPVRESGKLDDTPGIQIVGPTGKLAVDKGVVRAWRHIHMTPDDGRDFQVNDGDVVNVRLQGDRATTLEAVLIRISDKYALEMHIDTDEANAAGVMQESEGEIFSVSI